MTYEEALNFDQKWTELQAFNDLERYLLREEKPAMKAVAIAMQALEKQIPKESIKEKPNKYILQFVCPSCENKLFATMKNIEPYEKQNYCENCGQALDWSKEK